MQPIHFVEGWQLLQVNLVGTGFSKSNQSIIKGVIWFAWMKLLQDERLGATARITFILCDVRKAASSTCTLQIGKLRWPSVLQCFRLSCCHSFEVKDGPTETSVEGAQVHWSMLFLLYRGRRCVPLLGFTWSSLTGFGSRRCFCTLELATSTIEAKVCSSEALGEDSPGVL